MRYSRESCDRGYKNYQALVKEGKFIGVTFNGVDLGWSVITVDTELGYVKYHDVDYFDESQPPSVIEKYGVVSVRIIHKKPERNFLP